MQSMTYGTLPTREEFDAAFVREWPAGYHIMLGLTDSCACDDYKLGDGTWTADELWDAIEEIVNHAADQITVMDLVSGILFTLGFEWI